MRELQRERGQGHLVRDPSFAGSPHSSSMQWPLRPASRQDWRSVPGQCPESREQGRGQGSRPAFPQGWPGGWAAARTAQATLTLPKLSAYSRYSEDISCTEGQGVEGPCPPDATNPRTPKLAVLVPTEGQGWGRRSLPPSPETSGIPLWPPKTHLAAVMGLGHEQHAANEVCGGHPLGALAFSGKRGGVGALILGYTCKAAPPTDT